MAFMRNDSVKRLVLLFMLAVMLICTVVTVYAEDVWDPGSGVPFDHRNTGIMRMGSTYTQVCYRYVNTGQKCLDKNKTFDPPAYLDDFQLGRYPIFKTKFPCPDFTIQGSGCSTKLVCRFGDDEDKQIEMRVPCPAAGAKSHPEYPLVRMLSGTTFEWTNLSEPIGAGFIGDLKYGVNEELKTGKYIGAEWYFDVTATFTLSSIYVGREWSTDKANSAARAKPKLERTNIEFSHNGRAILLTAQDIFDAYKSKSEYVQAYLALMERNFGEREYINYQAFMADICRDALNRTQCTTMLDSNNNSLLTGPEGLYMGNANPTILGVYSEYSSHPCHGGSVIKDGQPAFAITVKSTWYYYLHLEWGDAWKWVVPQGDDNIYLGICCIKEGITKTYTYQKISCMGPDECYQHDVTVNVWGCVESEQYWLRHIVFEPIGGGAGSSVVDYGGNVDIYGFIKNGGDFSDAPLPISYYQSQPLLVSQ